MRALIPDGVACAKQSIEAWEAISPAHKARRQMRIRATSGAHPPTQMFVSRPRNTSIGSASIPPTVAAVADLRDTNRDFLPRGSV